MTASDLQKSFIFDTEVIIISHAQFQTRVWTYPSWYAVHFPRYEIQKCFKQP